MKANPESAPRIGGEFRRRRVRKFPYGIVYTTRGNIIAVVAVMHLHREPGYWKSQTFEG